MSRLETIKTNLKRLAADSPEQAFKELERLLSPQSPLFDILLLLQGQFKKFREEFLLGIMSQEQSTQAFARIAAALLQQIGQLTEADLISEKKPAPKPAEKRGELLYHVPHTMQLMHEEKCTVRIAWSEAALFEHWTRRKDDIHRRKLRIAEVMGVELLSLSDDSPFLIKPLHSTVQFLDEAEYTEWIFYVKPLRPGHFPLIIRISVIEMRDNREVKRELVLEEQVNVATETPPVEAGREEMLRAPLAYFSTGGAFAEAPVSRMGALRRYGMLLALLLLSATVFFKPWKWGNKDVIVLSNPNLHDSIPDYSADSFVKPHRHEQRMSPQNLIAQDAAADTTINKERERLIAAAEERKRLEEESRKTEHRRLALAERARRDKIKDSGLGSGGKSGNQGTPGGTGGSPFGTSPGSGGGTSGGAATGEGSDVGGGLGGRKIVIVSKPVIADSLQRQGTVRVKICVNEEGQVTSAEPTQSGSTTVDGQLRATATRAAMQFRFAPAPGAGVQCGWIDFKFILK